MANLTEVIEAHIKRLLKQNSKGIVEIRRRELARKFDCAPSQINYVLDTRFTADKGYIIESRRGGGGFIRIVRVDFDYGEDLVCRITENLDDSLTQHEAEVIVRALYDQDYISKREMTLLRTAINRKTLGLKLPLRDQLRARLLKNMLISLCRE